MSVEGITEGVPRPVLLGAGVAVLLVLVYAATRGGGSSSANGGTGWTVITPQPDPNAATIANADLSARTSAFNAVASVAGSIISDDAASTVARVQGDVSNRQTAAALEGARVQAWSQLQGQQVAAGATLAQAKLTADNAYDLARVADAGATARAGLADAGSTARAQIAASQAANAAHAANNTALANNAITHASGIGDAIGSVLGGIASFFGL